MGEARRRGTFKQRQAEGVAKREVEESKRAEERRAFLASHREGGKSTLPLATLIGLSLAEALRHKPTEITQAWIDEMESFNNGSR